jgi:hypothetical protein
LADASVARLIHGAVVIALAATLISWCLRATGVWISVREVDRAEALANSVLGLALGVGSADLGLAAVDGTWRAGTATSLS